MRHGGDRIRLAARANCAPEEILDFSVNLNPCGAPEYVAEVCCRALDRLAEYPSPYSERLCGIAAETFGVAGDRVLFGNGSWFRLIWSTGRSVNVPGSRLRRLR